MSAVAAGVPVQIGQRRRRSPRLPAVVWVVAVGFVALELTVAQRYGFHRDELYFIACAHHLAWGYVDQPPLAPLLVRLSLLWGSSPLAIRVLPALAGAGVVLIAAVFARDMGGRRFAAGMAALATAVMPVLLGASHLAGTTPYDLLAWSLTLLLVTRAITRDNPRLWLAAGGVAGVGLLDKHTIATFLVPALVVALAISRQQVLATRWPWLAGLLALAIGSPTLVWQAMHGWPELTMMSVLHAHHSAAADTIKFLPAQLLYAGPVLAPVWLSGLVRLLRAPELMAYRFLGWVYLIILVALQVIAPGRPYYMSALYVPLFAAGACWLEARARRPLRLPRRWWPTLAVVAGCAGTVIALPVMPVSFWHTVTPNSINYDSGEQIGWPQMTGQIAAAYHAIPAAERARTDIFTSNYGEAGAIDFYRTRYGLPAAASGHNAFWTWGAPHTTPSAVLIVGLGAGQWSTWCDSLHVVGHLSNSQRVQNDELGAPLTLCTGVKYTWHELWPKLQQYS